MIKFFRKIRQKLLSENKFSKYLLYAIGEIVLVVIGILIALQINNWSERRKNEILIQSYLLRLKEDFTVLNEKLNDVMKDEKRGSVSQYLILKAYEGNYDSIHPIQLAIAIERTASLEPYPKLSETWIDLINTGNIKMFKGTELKRLMDEYTTKVFWVEKANSEWDPYRIRYRELVRDILSPADRIYINTHWEPFNTETGPYHDYELEDDLVSIVGKLQAKEQLGGVLADVIMTRNWVIKHDLPDLDKSQKKILDYLDELIKS